MDPPEECRNITSFNRSIEVFSPYCNQIITCAQKHYELVGRNESINVFEHLWGPDLDTSCELSFNGLVGETQLI